MFNFSPGVGAIVVRESNRDDADMVSIPNAIIAMAIVQSPRDTYPRSV